MPRDAAASRLSLLVIGAGKAGRVQLAAAAALGGRALFVHDRDPAVAAAAARATGAVPVARIADARRGDGDLAIVCTPPRDHAARLADAAAAGFHVMIEKPLAASIEEARAIVDASGRLPVRVETVCQHRFSDGVAALRRRLAEGPGVRSATLTIRRRRTAETFRRLPWRLTRAEAGGGVLLAIGFHALDLAASLLGPPGPGPVTVTDWAFTGEVESRVCADAALGGIPLAIDAEWGDVADSPDTLRFDTDAGPVTLAGGALTPPGIAAVDRPTLHRRQLAAVIEALETGAPPVAPPSTALPALSLIFEAYRTVYGDCAVPVPPPVAEAVACVAVPGAVDRPAAGASAT